MNAASIEGLINHIQVECFTEEKALHIKIAHVTFESTYTEVLSTPNGIIDDYHTAINFLTLSTQIYLK